MLGLTRVRTATVRLLQKLLPPMQPIRGDYRGWYPVVREPYGGAWQRNESLTGASVLIYPAVFACVTRIAADIGKLCLRLMRQDESGIWEEAESPAFSPVLRRPNRYQITQKFVEQWIVSKLIHGNTYVLKERDMRGVVVALYVLDPTRVTPMVTADASIYYELKRDDLSTLPTDRLAVPASEIIHDTMVALYHPLIGVSPIYACAVAALQGMAMQDNSQKFFANGSTPGGILSSPGVISEQSLDRIKAYWETNFTGNNVGKVAALGDGLKYEPMTVNAVDAEFIDQLKMTGEQICTCFGVPPYMVGIGPPPPYANVEPLVQLYFSQCLQSLIVSLESHLDYGLGLPGTGYGTEFDIDDLIWMDVATKTKAAQTSITSGMSPDEVRKRYYGLGPVEGGNTPYLQVQNYSLAALARRDAASNPPPMDALPESSIDQSSADDDEDDEDMSAAFMSALTRKAAAEGWRNA